MLTEIQKSKLLHYFNVLDYDKNGMLEEDDFLAIGENLSILWGHDYEGEEYRETIETFRQQWIDISGYIGQDLEMISKEQWLAFADQTIVNGNPSMYEKYINNLTNEILNNFDTDKDGFISMMEFVDFFVGYRIEVRYSAKAFTKLDINKDGQVSREELSLALKDFFTSDDPNATGNWLFGGWE